jgi:hypothetical protein
LKEKGSDEEEMIGVPQSLLLFLRKSWNFIYYFVLKELSKKQEIGPVLGFFVYGVYF